MSRRRRVRPSTPVIGSIVLTVPPTMGVDEIVRALERPPGAGRPRCFDLERRDRGMVHLCPVGWHNDTRRTSIARWAQAVVDQEPRISLLVVEIADEDIPARPCPLRALAQVAQ